jgi:replicative DNA helicase Mcm
MNGIQTSCDNAALIDNCHEYLKEYERQNAIDAVQGDADAIHIQHGDIYRYDADLAIDVVEHPERVLGAFRTALTEIEIPVPGMETELESLDVRIHGVTEPQEIVSDLRQEHHLGKYMGVQGQVSLATQVKPKLMNATFRCQRCDIVVGPIPQDGNDIQGPHECPNCERQGPFAYLRDRSEFLDHQIVELTDPPGENPGNSGNIVPVHLYGDAAGNVTPGDRVRMNGLVDTDYAELANGSKVSRRMDWYMNGHAVDEEETAFEDVEPERVDEIQSIAETGDVEEQFVQSFAPSILTGDRGDMHKLAVILSLFGGHSSSDRDDINVFFIGAPGTGKSQYLKRAKTLAPKAVEASGKGATAAGLTATATKSETTGKWMLDAGALVLASGGVACIDEFDKMKDSVRQSMHEAMENQEVPINKAGINTTLTTETTVIAAANPKNGSFNRFDDLREQVDLGSPLLSRFDLIFGVSDTVDKDRDTAIATHQHDRIGASDSDGEPLGDGLMTEYIAYARQNVYPSYESAEPKERLVEYYTELRQESDGEEESVTPVTPRVNDALRRLAQASARMHLREEITMADAETAIELMDMTLGDTALEPDGTLNFGKREGTTPTTQEERIAAIKGACEEAKTIAEISEVTGISEDKVEHRVEKLLQKRELVEPVTGEYRVI